MELARQTVDVGLFTNQLAAMQQFYGEGLGLQFESVLPVGGGYKQHRYLANGSVIKLMHTEEPLPRRHPGGYETIMIASPKVKISKALADPDDNTVELIPPGQDDVTQLEVRLGARILTPSVNSTPRPSALRQSAATAIKSAKQF